MKHIRALVEFEYIIDLDLAIFKYIKANYGDSNLLKQDVVKLNNEVDIIKLLINRHNINPLEVLFDESYDTTDLYLDLYNNHMSEILEYAKACDAMALMVTYLRLLKEVSITVLCDSQEQADMITSINNLFDTKIASRESVVLNKYDTIYIKYYAKTLSYKNGIHGKNIYVSNARYNMEEEKDRILNIDVSTFIGYDNKIRTMDLYKNILY
jgi:hypothetical protein